MDWKIISEDKQSIFFSLTSIILSEIGDKVLKMKFYNLDIFHNSIFSYDLS
jgi:hypothetical protein